MGLKKYIRALPLFGPLVDVRPSDFWEAAVEILPNLVCSTIPIWLGSIIMLADASNDAGLYSLVRSNISQGELFLYSSALLGPLFYFVFIEDRTNPNFPSARSIMLLTFIIAILSGAFFAVVRAENLFEGSAFGFQKGVDQSFTFQLSWALYLAAVVIVYLAMVYRNYRGSGAAHASSTATREFVEEYMNRKRDE